ncbi:MAG: MiaB/RimO family radical SAM methylthiotransferase, partial [Clostridia bacterium]|nr:MiaB/RimO family radical SAM methylthiotransferase [Clostridia bacterium]
MNEKLLLEKKISAISLGCDKNRVDLEHMLGALKEKGFCIIDDIEEAEIIIVNTCAFISPAVKEAIDNILLAVHQKQNKCEKIIVTGCLNERYLNDIKQEIPEVDAFVRIKDNDDIIKTIYALYGIDSKDKNRDCVRLLTNYSHYAYLKIADGCNNGCAYCTIPRIRGRYRSVPMDKLIKEAKSLAEMGVKELIIVAQDITRYAEDLDEKYDLIDLLDKLSKIKNIEWIRLHYCYPEMVNNRLLDYITNNPKICKYLDIPLQHIDNEILYNMNRNCNELQTIICYANTPPTCTQNYLSWSSSINYIVVPDDSIELYKTASGWKDMANKIISLSEYNN